jgi:hypothetical protein
MNFGASIENFGISGSLLEQPGIRRSVDRPKGGIQWRNYSMPDSNIPEHRMRADYRPLLIGINAVSG